MVSDMQEWQEVRFRGDRHPRHPLRLNRSERVKTNLKKTKKIVYHPHQVFFPSASQPLLEEQFNVVSRRNVFPKAQDSRDMKTAVILAVVCVVAMMQLSARGASADVPFRNLEERAGSLANFFRSGNQPALRFGRGGVGNMPSFRFGRRSYDGIGDDDNLE
uniref:Uncharacterized protein n=1 Tax=Branchiostoma floridae TaxID=7739 RepID=C3Z6E3_BRAFL|eukprot:XP_002595875.1 hypothetical protein BRAFLDRAFT_84244 [Branchiostoma floridae]